MKPENKINKKYNKHNKYDRNTAYCPWNLLEVLNDRISFDFLFVLCFDWIAMLCAL